MARDDSNSLTEAEAQWRAAMRDLWYETRMERDRALLTLSAGGVALLVTLLTTVGVPWWWVGLLYAVAFTAFIVAIHAATAIFHRSAKHIMEAADDPAKAHESPLRPKLRKLDRRLACAFWWGVAFSIAVGVASASEPFFGGDDMAEKGKSETTQGTRPETRPVQLPSDQASSDGITNFAPPTPAPSDSGSDGSGGGGDGGSGGSGDSGEGGSK